MDSIGTRIRALREHRGWSMRELCRRTGISYATMWRVEHDKGKHAFQSIQAIAAALEVKTETLLGESPVFPAPAGASAVQASLHLEPTEHESLAQKVSSLSRRFEILEADLRLEPELRHAIEALKALPAKERKRLAKVILYMTGATNMDNPSPNSAVNPNLNPGPNSGPNSGPDPNSSSGANPNATQA